MLAVTNITYRIQGRPLFEGASFIIPDGAKAGFVGKNGSGKTTLFKLIQNQLVLDGGTIETNKRAKIGGVAQEAPATSLSVLETVMAADTERAELMAEAEHATDAHRIADIHMRLADIDAHTAGAFGRLADARGAGGRPVLATGPAAARRADQLSRSRRHAVAREVPRDLSLHRVHDQP
jgi:ATPase subunit of ABC transporter with duplicated ATPase domains